MSVPASSIERDFEHLADPRFLIKDVYGYPDPAVRRLLSSLAFNESLLLGLLPVDEASQMIVEGGYPPLELPEDEHGFLDLKRFHEPIITSVTERNELHLHGLSDFTGQYMNHGSQASIFTFMADRFTKGEMKELAFIDGEYDGYVWDAVCLGIPFTKFSSFEELGEPKEGRLLFVSNPSAVNGNWLDVEEWEQLVESGHDMVLDAAFAGTTVDGYKQDVSADNIKAVATTPSKGFGVFYHRYPGIFYTREPVDSLFDTTEFKDVQGLLATLALHHAFAPNELPQKLKRRQLAICASLSEQMDASITPSDSILIATAEDTLPPQFDDYLRAGVYRLGLKDQFALLDRRISNTVE